jgi:hypothetical protein
VAFHPLPNSREAANPGGTVAILRPGACCGDAGTRVASVEKPGHTPGNVKLLLPPRQSRGNSHCIRLQYFFGDGALSWGRARCGATKVEGFQANRCAESRMPCRDTNACASPSDIRTARQASPRDKAVTKLTPDHIRWSADFTGINIELDQSPALNGGPRAAATSLEADSQQVETPSASLYAVPIQQGFAAGVVAGDEKKAPGEKSSQEAPDEKSGAKGEKEGGSGDSGVAVAVFKFLVSKSGDVTLKAPDSGSAMPEGKTANDFAWKGPVATTAVYDELTLFGKIADSLGLEASDRLAYAEVGVSFYYSGKYINSSHAKLTDAKLDKIAELDCELARLPASCPDFECRTLFGCG